MNRDNWQSNGQAEADRALARLVADECGQDMIEYALLAAALVIVVAAFLPPQLAPCHQHDLFENQFLAQRQLSVQISFIVDVRNGNAFSAGARSPLDRQRMG